MPLTKITTSGINDDAITSDKIAAGVVSAADVADNRLYPNLTNSEETTNLLFDFLSNGFKLRSTYGGFNGSGGTYIYMAFAENPFVSSTGIPTTAR